MSMEQHRFILSRVLFFNIPMFAPQWSIGMCSILLLIQLYQCMEGCWFCKWIFPTSIMYDYILFFALFYIIYMLLVFWETRDILFSVEFTALSHVIWIILKSYPSIVFVFIFNSLWQVFPMLIWRGDLRLRPSVSMDWIWVGLMKDRC